MRAGRWSIAATAVVAGFGVGFGACSSPGDDPGPALPVDPAAIYAQMCSRCHGPDGRGDPELKKTLPVRDFSDPVFLARANSDDTARIIMAGKNQMPSFGGLLSVPKIQSVSGYVLRLGRASARAFGAGPHDVGGPAAPAPVPAINLVR